jgi:hypothetical protein
MTSDGTFPQRLTLVDELIRPDHSYLTAEDTCYFLGEYTARGGHSFSATNSLICNFKKSVEKRGQYQWRYKEQAIRQSAAAFRCAINGEWFDTATLVPIPPSKAKTDPLYDDRLAWMLQTIRPQPPLDIRELIVQRESTEAAHHSNNRPRPETLEALYEIDQTLVTPQPQVIGLFDDVLTTGAHFKAAQSLLNTVFPGIRVIGFFIARRAPETMDIEDIFGMLDD